MAPCTLVFVVCTGSGNESVMLDKPNYRFDLAPDKLGMSHRVE
jgi:hypothetical protein